MIIFSGNPEFKNGMMSLICGRDIIALTEVSLMKLFPKIWKLHIGQSLFTSPFS
jgi:hypothetical protein